MIKISVIIPVYNTEKYLKKCFDSIINQSLREIEIIIVNDGSPDNSQFIIDDFAKKDRRIVPILKENGGLSSARNTGIKRAKGEYILHIDSDDWVEGEYLKDLYEEAKKDNLDIVIADFYYDYNGERVTYTNDININEEILTGKNYLENYFFKGKSCFSVWNKMFKRSLYHGNDIFHPENLTLGEDLATVVQLAFYAKRIGKINKAYVHYVQRNDSIMGSINLKKANDLYLVYEELKTFYSNKDINIELELLVAKELLSLFLNSKYKISEYREEVLRFLNFLKKTKSKFELNKRSIYIFILHLSNNLLTIKLIQKLNEFCRMLKRSLQKIGSMVVYRT